jgi:hypothetical protein
LRKRPIARWCTFASGAIETAFRAKSGVKHRTNVNIDLRVVVRLPRDWDFMLVPDEVIAIASEFRGYRFAYVDDYYVICDPDRGAGSGER